MAPRLYGLMAEFSEPEALLRAAERTNEAGYRRFDAYAPWPVEGLAEAVGLPRNRVALLTLLGGMAGGLTGFGMQWFAAASDYPIDVAGRPFFSWPAFVPITFELTVLFGGLTAAFGMLALNGLPRLHHPVFYLPAFARASKDRFFLCIEAQDKKFALEETRAFLAAQSGALSVAEVPLEEELDEEPEEVDHAG